MPTQSQIGLIHRIYFELLKIDHFRAEKTAFISVVCNYTEFYNVFNFRCQIGDRHFPTLVAAKRLGNQVYALFTSKEETLRHSAVCIYDLGDIARQMRDAQYLAMVRKFYIKV